jgi:hypothetical protein
MPAGDGMGQTSAQAPHDVQRSRIPVTLASNACSSGSVVIFVPC